jgi:hypothetical protein
VEMAAQWRGQEVKRLFKRGALVVLVLIAFVLFCRGQGYEWAMSTDDAAKYTYDTITAHFACYRRYDENTEYDRVLRCKADADKLIRDKYKWW